MEQWRDKEKMYEDKGRKAFEIAQTLIDKKLVEINSVKEFKKFMEVMEVLMETL